MVFISDKGIENMVLERTLKIIDMKNETIILSEVGYKKPNHGLHEMPSLRSGHLVLSIFDHT